MYLRSLSAMLLNTVGLAFYVQPPGQPGPGLTLECTGYAGWNNQSNPWTDTHGLGNTNYPEGSFTTYFTTSLSQPLGTVVTIHGQYPTSRYMSLEVTSADRFVDFLPDVRIIPDPGQNNPFLSGTENGTYTVYLVFGTKPEERSPNTIYTGDLTTVGLTYRVYHVTSFTDPAGGATNPVTPEIWLGDQPLSNCPVQPYVTPPTASVWGRLANSDWHGTVPTAAQQRPASNPPTWVVINPSSAGYFPGGSSYYMTARLSRQYLAPNSASQVLVLFFKAPTFPNTGAGDPVYAPRQVRFWSLCTGDPYTTGVNRCVADDWAVLNPTGYATVVVSDPGSKPSDAALKKWFGTWLAWGALDLATDVVYDAKRQPWGLSSPVHYYSNLIYRQVMADPSFSQSMMNISILPAESQKAAMGAYWPIAGYCSTASFEARGINCMKR